MLGVVVGCFLGGLFAETALVHRLGKRVERLALFVPGYALMTSVGANLVGVELTAWNTRLQPPLSGIWPWGMWVNTP
jgi:hypothetical protein